jgi:uncharacterized membrane protein YeaQ/YmgE (transglycosylase-associated protein family)
MSRIAAILVGTIVGWIPSMIMGDREGLLGKILIGIGGSVLAKWLFADLLGIGGASSAGSLSPGGILWGVVGAVVLIWLLRAGGFMRKAG